MKKTIAEEVENLAEHIWNVRLSLGNPLIVDTVFPRQGEGLIIAGAILKASSDICHELRELQTVLIEISQGEYKE